MSGAPSWIKPPPTITERMGELADEMDLIIKACGDDPMPPAARALFDQVVADFDVLVKQSTGEGAPS